VAQAWSTFWSPRLGTATGWAAVVDGCVARVVVDAGAGGNVDAGAGGAGCTGVGGAAGEGTGPGAGADAGADAASGAGGATWLGLIGSSVSGWPCWRERSPSSSTSRTSTVPSGATVPATSDPGELNHSTPSFTNVWKSSFAAASN
jgi:hypothetical protein